MPKEFDLSKYTKLFVTESREYLRTLNEAMLELESDHGKKDLVDQMFRACHTMKGMAGMMNMPAVSELSHALEDVLAAVRDGKIVPEGEVAETMFEGFDALEGMVNSVEKGDPIQPAERLVERLRNLPEKAKKAAAPSKERKQAEQKGKKETEPQVVQVHVAFHRKCALPAARAMVIIKELEKSAHIRATDPSEDEIEHEKVFEELVVDLEPGEHMDVSLDRVVAMTDVEEVRVGPKGAPAEQLRRISKAAAAAPTQDAAPVQTVRVGMDKLDELLDDVGELVISRSRLVERASTKDDMELQEISSLIDKLTSEIQSKVLGIRMIPLDLVMSRFPRMVRDLSRSQGKEVEFLVEGGDIELDRTVVDRIADPIVHIIRNCIDHGLETAEERAKTGKRAKGLIRIAASKQQDHVLIEISDDGKGIDFDTIRKAAVSRGVMTKEQADAALGRELMELLFRPGFSTKAEVTEISGRGVGLDVVKRGVEELGGTVMINTTKGAGTTISLWLPFTLAIIDAMLVTVAEQMYAIPMSVVAESHSFEHADIRQIRTREVVQLRGEVLPLIRMRDFFSIPRRSDDPSVNAMVVQSRERRAALAVDELLGHQQIVVKGLDRRLRRTKGISGGTILGSGNIALILDVDTILGE